MIREAIEAVVSGESLSMEAAAQVMNEIMSGKRRRRSSAPSSLHLD